MIIYKLFFFQSQVGTFIITKHLYSTSSRTELPIVKSQVIIGKKYNNLVIQCYLKIISLNFSNPQPLNLQLAYDDHPKFF